MAGDHRREASPLAKTARLAQERDPDNALLWRHGRQRLDGEAIRDALLAVSGRLDPTVGGPSVPDVLKPQERRRTVYGRIDRLHLPGVYRTFDFPDPSGTNPKLPSLSPSHSSPRRVKRCIC